VERAIQSNSEPCHEATSEEQIQDLFYIAALKLIGQNRAYLVSKKRFDETISIVDRMEEDDLENFVVNLADVYARNNGVLDRAVNYFNGINRQSDASKLTQLKDTIRGDNAPAVTLLDETNPLIMEHLNLSSGNFTQEERQLQIGNCYVLPSDVQGLNDCETHAYLRNLTQMMKRHLERTCTYCDMTDTDNITPRTREGQNEVMISGECRQFSNFMQLHSIPDECLAGRGRGTDTTQQPTTTAPTVTSVAATTTTTIASGASHGTTHTSQTPPDTTSTMSNQPTIPEPQHGQPTNPVGMNVNEVGNSLSGTGEVSSTMGYYNYGSGVINTPDPMTYDNGADYRAMANATRMNGGDFNVGANDEKKNMQKIIQKDLKGVSNIFAPRIIIKNYHGKPEDNEIKAYNA